MDKRHRSYMITTWEEPNFNSDHISYYVYQKEMCPTTKKEHYQCYIELNEGICLKRLKKIIGDNKAHIEPRLGSQKDAIAYCTKEETRIGPIVSEGIKKEQGKRTDLEFAVAKIKEETDLVDILIEKPNLIKYINHLEKFKTMYNAKYKKRIIAPIVEVIIGEPGSGKTRQVVESETDLYIVPEATSSQFFDGYSGEKAALIDDFKGNIRFNFLLQLLDRYNIRVNTKGGTTMWMPEKIYITSNYEPTEWYPNNSIIENRALMRRISKVTHKCPGNTNRALTPPGLVLAAPI